MLRKSMSHKISILTTVIVLTTVLSVNAQTQETKTNTPDANALARVINDAFRATHDGWSSDEVILNDELRRDYLLKCQELMPGVSDETFCWSLLNLRKAGKLETKSTRRANSDINPVTHVAEIAARSVCDRFKVSTDRVMVSAEKRTAFDESALSVDPNVDLYLVRKAAFKLRKARKLKPELITRIADWGRVIYTCTASEVAAKPNRIPEHPGIYIFRDKSGYLYIGQTENLRKRLIEHLDQSHSKSLANYLSKQGAENISIEVHSFDPDSRARETMIRRAYESELIASRKPRFNIQP